MWNSVSVTTTIRLEEKVLTNKNKSTCFLQVSIVFLVMGWSKFWTGTIPVLFSCFINLIARKHHCKQLFAVFSSVPLNWLSVNLITGFKPLFPPNLMSVTAWSLLTLNINPPARGFQKKRPTCGYYDFQEKNGGQTENFQTSVLLNELGNKNSCSFRLKFGQHSKKWHLKKHME